jgi:hypothetical protein
VAGVGFPTGQQNRRPFADAPAAKSNLSGRKPPALGKKSPLKKALRQKFFRIFRKSAKPVRNNDIR